MGIILWAISRGCDFVPIIGDHYNEPIFLTPLADFGGLTRTHAILGNSAAVDAGSPETPGSGGEACAPTDQRDALRPIDGNLNDVERCDPGAYEYQGVETIPQLLVSLSNPTPIFRVDQSNPDAFEVLVLGANGGEVAGIPVTFSAPAAGPGGLFSASGSNSITVTTGSSGQASSGEFITNSAHGDYLVEADVGEIPQTIAYQVTNTRANLATYDMDHRNDDYLPGDFLCDEIT